MISVLKKRELRLKREQDGLKSVISGLVGGPALLREWEREWKEKFGGEERDEIEGDDAAAASDDEDGEGEDSDGDDGDDGRAKKKAKVVKPVKKEKSLKPTPPPPATLAPGAAPEKRKRGRPRKVPLPAAVSSPITLEPIEGSMPATNHQSTTQATQEFIIPTAPHTQPAQQYLLAAFAFFSVFNSPLAPYFSRTSSNHDYRHAHHGSVLSARPSMVPTHSVAPSPNYGMNELAQAFHLLVSTLVFFYVVFPWLSGVLRGSWASGVLQKLRLFSTDGHGATSSTVAPPSESPTALAYQRVILTDALSPAARGSADEAARLRRALGVSTGVYGLMQSIIKAARTDRGLEMNQLEQRAWVRLGELVAFDGS